MFQTLLLESVTINHDTKRIPVKEAERKSGPYPYYGASGIVDHVDGYLFDGEYLLVAEDGENLRTRNTPIAFRANGKFWVNNHAHIIQGNDKALTRYLEYAVNLADIASYLTGSTMPKLTQGNLNRLPIIVPPIDIQKKIVKIIGEIDDKIELNNQINETLESMAKAIFKEWFIDFGPVKAKAEGKKTFGMDDETASLFPNTFEDSEVGQIPKGWRQIKLSDLLDTISETYKFAPSEEVIFLNTSDILKGDFLTDKFSDSSKLPGQAKKRIKKGDILYSEIRPENGRYALVHFDSPKHVVSTKLMVLRSKKIDPIFLYFYLTRNEFISEMQRMAEARSGTFPQITFEVLGSRTILLPDEALLNRYIQILKPIYEQKLNLATENKRLKDVRDLLLPKLMSGEISLNDV